MAGQFHGDEAELIAKLGEPGVPNRKRFTAAVDQ